MSGAWDFLLLEVAEVVKFVYFHPYILIGVGAWWFYRKFRIVRR